MFDLRDEKRSILAEEVKCSRRANFADIRLILLVEVFI